MNVLITDDARDATAGSSFLRSLMGLSAVYFGCLSSFFLLLASLPLYLSEQGTAMRTTPGLSTGVLMLTSMVAGLLTPALSSRLGYRAFLITGLVLMTVSSVSWPFVSGEFTVVLASVVRGAAFAGVVVGVGSVASWSLPARRRGEGLSVLGIVSMSASLIGLPSGVWLAQNVGYTAVFALAAACPLVAIAPVCWLATPVRASTAWWTTDRASLWLSRKPAVVLAVCAMLSGVMITHLPPVVGRGGVSSAARARRIGGGRPLAYRPAV
jgi:MFS family permease